MWQGAKMGNLIALKTIFKHLPVGFIIVHFPPSRRDTAR